MQVRNHFFLALVGFGAGLGSAQGQPIQLINVANIPTVTYLGVGWRDVSPDQARELKLPEEAGVEVTYLAPGSPAAVAGIRIGDVIMQYNGQRVEGREQIERLLRETPAGREVKLKIYRNGAPQLIVAKPVASPAELIQGVWVPIQTHPQPFQNVLQDVPRNHTSWISSPLGAELESLEPQLADTFGANSGGVLVRSVMRGSAGDRAGLKAGDVITRVADVPVTTPQSVSGRIRTARGQSATLTVLREHREMSVTVALDGNRSGDQ